MRHAKKLIIFAACLVICGSQVFAQRSPEDKAQAIAEALVENSEHLEAQAENDKASPSEIGVQEKSIHLESAREKGERLSGIATALMDVSDALKSGAQFRDALEVVTEHFSHCDLNDLRTVSEVGVTPVEYLQLEYPALAKTSLNHHQLKLVGSTEAVETAFS